MHKIYLIVISLQPVLSFYNVCQTHKNDILSNDDCEDLYFESNDKATNLGNVKLELENNSFKIIPLHLTWTRTFVKITKTNNNTTPLCSKITVKEKFYCFSFTPDMQNETYQLDYKAEHLPDINFRRFTFTLPPPDDQTPIFPYVDQTDLSRLILKTQKLAPITNITYLKVEAFKEKNGNTNLQDFQHFPTTDELTFQLFTYNDVGNYFFVVTGVHLRCPDSICFYVKTPNIYIGRKSTRMVIGIVGASFILPFILFVFHILTKKYPQDKGKLDENYLIVYKSSTRKHNEVVLTLAALLEEVVKSKLDVIDVSKNSKFTEKVCNDLFIVADYIIYIPSPKQDVNPVFFNKHHNNLFCLLFEYTSDQLPDYSKQQFRMFDEYENFLENIKLTKPSNEDLFQELIRKTEEAKAETEEQLNILPKIIITDDSEAQEYDSLISK